MFEVVHASAALLVGKTLFVVVTVIGLIKRKNFNLSNFSSLSEMYLREVANLK